MQREKGHTPKSKWDEEAAVAAKHIQVLFLPLSYPVLGVLVSPFL
jgi:hypothetical protein